MHFNPFFFIILMDIQLLDSNDNSGCKLLDSFAIAVQLMLACLAFSTLIIKRQREIPQRPLLVW